MQEKPFQQVDGSVYVPAKALNIVWGNDDRFWKWKTAENDTHRKTSLLLLISALVLPIELTIYMWLSFFMVNLTFGIETIWRSLFTFSVLRQLQHWCKWTILVSRGRSTCPTIWRASHQQNIRYIGASSSMWMPLDGIPVPSSSLWQPVMIISEAAVKCFSSTPNELANGMKSLEGRSPFLPIRPKNWWSLGCLKLRVINGKEACSLQESYWSPKLRLFSGSTPRSSYIITKL